MAKGGGKRAKAPTMAKAKKMVTKQRKQKAKRNMDTYFLKTKSEVVIIPSQGVSVANYVYASFLLNSSGTDATSYTQNAEFKLWALQYDKFRVNSVKVTVIPKANVLDQQGAQNDGAFNVTGDGWIHTVIDRDGVGPSSKALLSRYPSYRKYSVMKPFTRSYSIRYPTGIWLDCDAPATFTMNKELGLTGGFTMYGENFLEDNYEAFNEPWATVLVEYNIVFQGKTSNSLTGVYDESGNLTGVTINAIRPDQLLEPSLLRGVSGSLDKDTRIVDEVNDATITDLGEVVV